MEYNTLRQKMAIPEYGTNIQSMIEHLFTIEDRIKRTQAAYYIVSIMAQMNPQVRESSDYLHKLWDHLHIISDFKLDVDSPYDPPKRENVQRKPRHVGYNSNEIRYGHYGLYTANLINKAILYDEGNEKTALVQAIANYMKKQYLSWNRDSVTDETISLNLNELSGGRLTLTEDMKLVSTNEILSKAGLNQNLAMQKQKKKFNQKPGSQGFQKKKQR